MNFPGSWRNIEIWSIWARDVGFEEFPKTILYFVKGSKFNTQFTLRLRYKGTSHLMEWQSPGIEAVEGLKRYFDNIINNKNNL